jgi:hypothetical protein
MELGVERSEPGWDGKEIDMGLYMPTVMEQWWQNGLAKNEAEIQKKREQEQRDLEEAQNLMAVQEKIKAQQNVG